MSDRIDLYRRMLLIRRFEERLLALFRTGELRGTAHVCIGQEAVAVGACAALEREDTVVSNHRGHGHMLARGADARRVMAELFGRETGYALGRGGSQHVAALEVGFLGSNGITGGGLPIATGAGLSHHLGGRGAVSLAFFGDGATAQGTFHESMNLAMVWRLPVVFVCENNHYAMGTHVSATCPTRTLAQRAAGYGMPRTTVDGNDVEAVFAAVREARALAAQGKGPFFVEAVTYRVTGHSRSDACEYRSAGEADEWLDRDPLDVLVSRIADDDADDGVLQRIADEVKQDIDDAVEFARDSAPLPVERAEEYVFPKPVEAINAKPLPAEESSAREMTYAEAIRLALAQALQDESVVLLGEDIADYNGAFRVTDDLYERFGRDRVRNTPISENTIVGCGVGAAITGMRPVVEIMFMDFLPLAFDQLMNHAAKYGYIFGGQGSVPLTVRTPAGGRRGYGATHSQCLESMLLSVPGLKVYAPYSAQDAYDLTLAAIYDDGPVVLVEHKLLYGEKGMVDPEGETLPPGRARILRTGNDLTIISFSHMLGLCLQTAEALSEHGVEAEVIDLCTLCPLDRETLIESACRTQRVVIAEEGVLTGGVGAEIAAMLQRECFGYLDAPIVRVGAKACPIPTAEHLERVILPQAQDIADAAQEVLS